MKSFVYSVLATCLLTNVANAACYADYKAKQDDPLRLHYGVAAIEGDCSVSDAATQLSGRLSSNGWELLNVLSVFDDAQLDDKKDSAGDYFLRF